MVCRHTSYLVMTQTFDITTYIEGNIIRRGSPQQYMHILSKSLTFLFADKILILHPFMLLPIFNELLKTVNRKVQEEPQAEATATPDTRRGGREKVTQIDVCIANKQMHDKHKVKR